MSGKKQLQQYFLKRINEYFLLILFILGAIFYLNIDKVPLTNPGNIKAADPFGHVLVAEGIINTKQWNYYDIVFSLGKEKIVNSQPPLYYLNTAELTQMSGLPAWVSFYFFVCISQAMIILFVYLITNELFENKEVSLIAAILSVLPLQLNAWLYGLFIGFWLQVPSNMFLMCFLWLFIRFMKRKETWALFFTGVSIAAIMITHPQDLFVIVLPCILIGISLLKDYLYTKDIASFAKKGVIFCIIPILIFLPLLPRFLYVWGAQGGEQLTFGYYGIRSTYFTREYSGGLVFPDIFFIPAILLFLFGLSMIQLLLNLKKYLIWVSATIYFFMITYLLPIIVFSPYYFARIRALTPFIIFPSIAYGFYNLFIVEAKKIKYARALVYVLLFMFLVYFTYYDYTQVQKQAEFEHVSMQEWEAYKWIHENAGKDAKILFFGTVFQHEFIYSERITAAFEINDFINAVNQYIATNTTQTNFKVTWGGETTRTVHKYEKSFWSYGTFQEPSSNVSILDFDYIFFQDLNEQIAYANRIFINEYMNRYGFYPVYSKDGYIILKNAKQQPTEQ